MTNSNASLAVRAAAELELRKRRAAGRRDLPYDVDTHDVVTFIENEMYIPETGAPMTLHPQQRAVLRAMFTRDDADNFRYHTMLYSAIKKSAKTTIAAGVALWQAHRVADGEIYLIGNDQKQADNRMAQAIRYCITHNPKFRDHIHVSPSRFLIKLPNRTKIEAIPVDPAGEAGMNPTALFWTEAWGAKGAKAELLWTEAQLSPTRQGKSFRFIESYAGYVGESPILEPLWSHIVQQGMRDERADELHVNGRMIAYWNTHPYLEWQTDDYYADQAAVLSESEFRRIHKNEWVSSEDVFVPYQWWLDCAGTPPPLPDVVCVGVDAGVVHDTFAVVCVTKQGEIVYVRECKVWTPPKGGKVDFGDVERYLMDLKTRYSVREVAYDPMQMEHMANRLQSKLHMRAFLQGADRLVADKMLYDAIRDGQLSHVDDPILNAHVANANAKIDGESGKLRIVKRNIDLPIDAAVALSMAHARARYYLR